MASRVKLRLCLLALSLFLASVSVGLGDESEGAGGGVGVHDGCLNHCEELKGNADEFAACEGECGLNQRVSPRREFEVCQRRCQAEERGQEQQRRCLQRCQEQLREREQRGGRGGDGDDEDQWREPEREKEEQRRREHEREERRRRERERERERGRGSHDENQRDPEREREERRREQERRRREQERRERERERRGERDEDENQRDPDWRREQQRREQEERRREQERRERERRERERRGERDEDENQRDPDWRREQQRREQEERRREQERRERERRGERDEDENQRDPDWRREQERRHREQERREREREREHEGGGRDENQRDRRGREEQRSREEEWEREERRREREHGGGRRGRANQVEVRREEQEQRHNPYYFQEHQFRSRFRSEEGHWRILEKFSERSDLLRGIKNQRFAILEARPQTFIIPHHLDAETVLLVVRGRATLTTVYQEKRETRKESYSLERGDVMTVPAGTTVYLVNHENEDLQIVKLMQPVNNPGEFKDYLSAGGEAQAYYSVFSNDVLEAALNIPREKLERIFKQHVERRGKIISAPQEQLRALSQRASTRRGGRGTRAPIKLESQTPVYSNQYGQMFEACPNEFQQLRNNDVAAAVLDIKEGGMMVPHYNSRTTWVVFVSEGTGSFEMACPHIQGGEWQRERGEDEGRRRWGEEEEEREGSGRIERVAGRLSPGGVLVVPAGHPIAIMASPNEKLRLVGFGINAENNRRNFLAGRENIMNEVDREAKELAFNVEGKQADEIFRSQKESFFTEGPEGGRRRSTERRPLLSILKLAGYL